MSRHSIAVAVDAFLVDCRSRRLKPTTVEWYGRMLTGFVSFLKQNEVEHLESVKANLIRLYFLELQDANLKGSSQNGAGRAMRAFLNFCVREGWLTGSPMTTVRLPRVDQQILPAFTDKEVQILLGLCKTERERALLMFMIDTGLRVQEVANVEMKHLNLETRSVFVSGGKGGKDRITFFGNKTHKALNRYFMELGRIPDAGSLWLSKNSNQGLTKQGIQMIFKDLKRRSGIAHCSAHTCRRTFAIWNLRNGMNIFVLQQLMGHSDLDVLKRYLALVERDPSHTSLSRIG